MALKEAYTSKELVPLLDCAVQSINRSGKRDAWQSRPRSGRGGGNEWLFASMPEATQRAIEKAEAQKAIEAEAAKSPGLPEALGPTMNLAALPPNRRQAILDDKRRYKALAKADLLDLYLNWQIKYGATVAQKDAFICAYQGGAWPKLLTELGGKISWKSIERWKLERKELGSVLALADCRGLAHRGKSMLTNQHKSIILGQALDGERQISTSSELSRRGAGRKTLMFPLKIQSGAGSRHIPKPALATGRCSARAKKLSTTNA